MKSDNEQLNRNINEGLYKVPNQNQTLKVFVTTVETNTTLCQNSNEEWTPWRSASSSHPNDYETLVHHRRKFRFIRYFVF